MEFVELFFPGLWYNVNEIALINTVNKFYRSNGQKKH